MYLVLGAHGMLGSEICSCLQRDGIEYHTLRLDGADEWIGNIGYPEAIINCAGVRPGADPLEMIRINALVPHQLRAMAPRDAKIFYVSTDCVFSGQQFLRPYRTYDTPDPDSLYGATKRVGELSANTVIRTSFVGEWHGLLRWALDNKGQEVNGWLGARWNGSTVIEVAEAILKVVRENPGSNIIHVSSPRVITKFDILMAIDAEYKLNLRVKPAYEPRIYRALEPSIGYEIKKSFKDALHDYYCCCASRSL